jgi:hypothetical protein
VKSNAQDSFENNDYKTFLRRSSGVWVSYDDKFIKFMWF